MWLDDPYAVYMVHWIVHPVVVGSILALLWREIRQTGVLSFFLLGYFVFIYARAAEVHLEVIDNNQYIITVWLIPYIFCLVAGPALYWKRHAVRQRGEISPSYFDYYIFRKTPLISVIMCLTVIVFVLDKGLGEIPLIHALVHPGATRDVLTMRMDALSSSVHPLLSIFYGYATTLIWPVYLAFLAAGRSRDVIGKKHFWFVFITGLFFLASTAEKAPVAIALVAVGITVITLSSEQGRTVRKAMRALPLLLIPSLMYPLLYGMSGLAGIEFTITRLWRRLTWVPSRVSGSYFDAFGGSFDHLGLRSNRFLANLGGVSYEPANVLVYEEYYSSSLSGGRSNASFFASFYADWGFEAAIVGVILVIAILVLLDIALSLKWNRDAIGTAVLVLVSIGALNLMLTNFYSVALGRGLVSLPLFLIVIKKLIGRRTVQ